MPLLLPLLLAGGGVAALAGTAGYAMSGGVRATSEVTKWAAVLALGVGALWVYKNVVK
jgi:hypothetical protein